MDPKFVHLHLHTEYSLSDSVIRVPSLIQRTVELGMPAVAVTDLANIYAMVKFYGSAVSAGVKPIIGVDAWIHNAANVNAPFRLVLLATSPSGYHGLCELVSRAYLENQHQGRACIDKSWLREYESGLIALSGSGDGELGQALMSGSAERARQVAEEYTELFPDAFYVEIQRIGRPHEDEYIAHAVDLASNMQLPVVATNAVQFLQPAEFGIHEVRVCINEGRVLNDRRRPHRYTEQQYFRSPAEMIELFADIPEALENTVEIAKRCNFTLDIGDYYLPDFPLPPGRTTEQELRAAAHDGLEQLAASIPADDRSGYADRLNMELEVIIQMGFAGYFLIVADFISWARENGIPVGPGRGSGAGSLVAYALGITRLDPIEHGLLFERFLNPERVSLPDFDIDFCMEGRDRVIEYVAEHYGRARVSQIITYGTMAARAVVRDVGRVMGMPYGYVDKIAKLIPFQLNITLDEALATEEMLRDQYEKEGEVRELLDTARALEGLVRNVGKHAGGVVIAPSPLTDFTALYREQGGDQAVTQFDKDDLEAIGLVKFDFLGLRTLTIIDRAVRTINLKRESRGESPVVLDHLPTDDKKTFQLIRTGKTTALFQLESRGMKEIVHRMQPDRFEDLVALVALHRPGPLQSGMVDDFMNRKHGRSRINYLHPALEPILQPTYGVILYQEQVMEIARVLGGYTLGTADLLRRAMGKKKTEEMAEQREIFISGARGHGVGERVATAIFDLMEKFANYGFNKSHSAAYAVITYQTAWLKAHYPGEFMAAALSADMEHTDKVVTLLAECRDIGLEVISPDVNRCNFAFETDEEGQIRYGLGAIKGIGYNVIEAIVDARGSGGPFDDLFDLCGRVDIKRVNRRALESLIQAGAMDGLGPHRASLMASLPLALNIADQKSTNESVGQSDLFGAATGSKSVRRFADVPEWSDEQRLSAEKDTLGLYLSGHPINAYRDDLAQIVDAAIGELNPTQGGTVVVAGLIVGLRVMNTRRGDRMAFVTLDDQTGRLELAVFSELFNRHRDLLRKDNLLVVSGQVNVDEYTGGFKMAAEALYDIEQARSDFSDRLVIDLRRERLTIDTLSELESALKAAESGNCPVWIRYVTDDAEGILRVGEDWRVKTSEKLISRLRDIVGQDCVTVAYRRHVASAKVDTAA